MRGAPRPPPKRRGGAGALTPRPLPADREREPERSGARAPERTARHRHSTSSFQRKLESSPATPCRRWCSERPPMYACRFTLRPLPARPGGETGDLSDGKAPSQHLVIPAKAGIQSGARWRGRLRPRRDAGRWPAAPPALTRSRKGMRVMSGAGARGWALTATSAVGVAGLDSSFRWNDEVHPGAPCRVAWTCHRGEETEEPQAIAPRPDAASAALATSRRTGFQLSLE